MSRVRGRWWASARVAAFKTFRQLTDDWIALAIQRAHLGPLEQGTKKSKQPRQDRKPRQR